MFTNTHPATTLIVKSDTLAQVQSEDKTCDRMAKDDIGIWWEGRGGAVGWGVGVGGSSCCYLLSDEPLSAGDVITQHH